MGITGKISVIKKEVSVGGVKTMDKALRAAGYTRVPGTGVTLFPYKELNGKYRTGLDPEASYIERIQDPHEQAIEMERVTRLKAKLEKALNIDLGPRSKFWNYTSNEEIKISPIKLSDGDNLFDLSDPLKELTYSWLRVHPMIASSYQAYLRGDYPSSVQFYVADDDIEDKITYKKKQQVNRAIVQFEEMTPDKKKKVARLMGLPITDNTKEEYVYNQMDTLLKKLEFDKGEYANLSTIEVFNRFSGMDEGLLEVKDLVRQAIKNSIYRIKGSGRIFEGDNQIAESEDDLVKYLMDDEHQDELIILEKKLNIKKQTKLT